MNYRRESVQPLKKLRRKRCVVVLSVQCAGVLCMCTRVQSECWQLRMWFGVSGYSPRPAPLAGLTFTLLAPPQLPPKREVVPLLRMKVTGTSSDMDKIPTGTAAG